MKFLIRILFLVVLLIAALFMGGYLYLTPERLHTLIQPRLQQAFNRTVAFQNAQLHYGLEPGISLSHLTIHNRAGFGQKPLINAEQAHIAISPFEIISGQKFGELRLENATLAIVVNRKGDLNIADLTQTKGPQIPINQLHLINTTVSYHNQQTAHKTTVRLNNATLLATPTEGGIALAGNLETRQITHHTPTDSTGIGAFTLAYRLTYHPKNHALTVHEFTPTIGPIAFPLSGHINALWQKPDIQLQTRKQTLDLTTIKNHLIDQGSLSPKATLSGNGQYHLQITGTYPPKITGDFKLTNLSLSDPKRIKNPIINAQLHLTLANDQLKLHTLKAQTGPTDLTLSGVFSNLYNRPHLSFAWISHTLDLDALPSDAAQSLTTCGFATPAYAAAPGTKKSALISLLQSIDMDGSIYADSLRIYNTTIYNFATTTHAQNGTLHLKPITGQAHQGAINAALTLTTHSQGAHLETSASLINARANPFINQTLKGNIPLYGILNLTARITGTFDTTLTLLVPTRHATGKMQMTAGKLVKWPLLQNNLKSIEQLGLLTADEVPIQNATLVFTLQGNTLTLNGTQLSAADMPCRISGTGESGGILNYALDVDVPPSRIQFGGFNLGSLLGQRAIPIRINIGGTTAAPKVTAGMR